MKWSHFDNWLVKFAAFCIIVGGVWWMAFAVYWHYHTGQTAWEFVPFIISGIFIVFAAAILAKKTTEGAASVVMPFVDIVVERFARLGRRKTDSFAVVVPPRETQKKPEDVEGA